MFHRFILTLKNQISVSEVLDRLLQSLLGRFLHLFIAILLHGVSPYPQIVQFGGKHIGIGSQLIIEIA